MPNTRRNPKDPDSPFITREGMRNARPFRERYPNVDLSKVEVVCVPNDSSRHALGGAGKRRTTNIQLSSDIVTKLRAMGPQWPELADKILRDGLKKLKQKAA